MTNQEFLYFERVCELNNLSKVAQEYNVTPSSVSSHISDLEKELGAKLFDRNGKHIQLNSNGKIVYNRFSRINDLMTDAEREIRDNNGEPDYSITISSITIPRVIPLILRDFRKDHPSIKLTIAQYQKSHDIASMNCDVMLYSTSAAQSTENSFTFYEEPILLLASKQHPLAKKRSGVEIGEIVAERFIRASEGADFGTLTGRIMKQLGISPEIAIVSDYPEFVMELISANMGLSFQPGLTYQFYYRNQNITPLYIKDFSPVRYINIAWDKNRYYSKATDTFVKYVCNYLKKLSEEGIPGRYLGGDRV